MPPIRYLRLLRMERAKNLLESSFLSVKEIAFQVGLNDESHFVRDFKTTYGYSPALYRAQFMGGVIKAEDVENHNGGSGNVNGNGNGNDDKRASVQQQLARAAKQSVLVTLQLFIPSLVLVCS